MIFDICSSRSFFIEWVSERVCRVQRPTQHMIGHFGDKSFHAINCTGTDNQKQHYIHQKHKRETEKTAVDGCTAGDHRVHSDATLLWIHGTDDLHVLAADRHDWILRRLLLHPQDLRRYQDRLSRRTICVASQSVSVGLMAWFLDAVCWVFCQTSVCIVPICRRWIWYMYVLLVTVMFDVVSTEGQSV